MSNHTRPWRSLLATLVAATWGAGGCASGAKSPTVGVDAGASGGSAGAGGQAGASATAGRGGGAGGGGAAGGSGAGAAAGGSAGGAAGTGGNIAIPCTGSPSAEDPSVYTARKPSSSNRYLPLAVGAHWGWLETNVSTGASGMRQSWVESLDALTGTKAGISAYRVHSTTLTGSTVIWQQDSGTAVLRHRSQFLDGAGAMTSSDELVPSQLRLDEAIAHLAAGATWIETYTDTKTRARGVVVTATLGATWTVDAVGENVTVPAGTFSCVRLHRVEPPSALDSVGGDNVYWFARGVGKVKETGTVTHELLGYCYP